MKIKLWLLSCLLLWAHSALASDLANDVRKNISDPESGSSNYYELVLGVNSYTNPNLGQISGSSHTGVLAGLNFHAEYKNIFLENSLEGHQTPVLGYSLPSINNWSFDAILLNEHDEKSSDVSHVFDGLKTRKWDALAGVRATGYFENYIVQVMTAKNVFKDYNGGFLSVELARHWQLRNWNFHAIVGAKYITEGVADYYLSVAPEDANDKFSAFDAHAGFTGVVEVGATYPISQKWIFRSLLRHVELDQQWTGSPLITSDHGDAILASVHYVF